MTTVPVLPGPLRTAAAAPLAEVLQREQRTRTTATAAERAALLPQLDDDITVVEDLTGLSLDHWRSSSNGADRSPLDVRRRFGTAFDSIDRPGG